MSINFNVYLEKLIYNLLKKIDFNLSKKKPIEIDLVLGGGAFNGSYIIGCLLFLKEMEKKKYIIIKRISACSIGSILGLLYIIDKLDYYYFFHKKVITYFKKYKNLKILFKLKKELKEILPNNILEKINNILFISYNNINNLKKCVVYKYKNIDKLLNYLLYSCYMPFFINYEPIYKNKYIDGILPYIFNNKNNREILYINVYTFDKIFNMLDKNEKKIFHKIFTGIIEIYNFYMKKSNNLMCSYISKWNLSNYLLYYNYLLIEKIIIYYIFIFNFLKNKNTYNINYNIKYIIKYILDYML